MLIAVFKTLEQTTYWFKHCNRHCKFKKKQGILCIL